MKTSSIAFGIVAVAFGAALGIGFTNHAKSPEQDAFNLPIAADASAETLVMPVPQEVATVTEERVRELVRAEIEADPRFVLEAINSYLSEQQSLEAGQADERTVAVKDRIAATQDKPFVGNPDGPVELVYFFDVNCGFCKRLEPTLTRIIAENPDVKISHREIPILAESSRTAALVAGMVWENNRDDYSAFHDGMKAFQGTLSTADISRILVETIGVDDANRILTIVNDTAHEAVAKVSASIDENLEVANVAGITGTPFVYVLGGDGLLRGAGEDAYDQLTAMISAARNQ